MTDCEGTLVAARSPLDGSGLLTLRLLPHDSKANPDLFRPAAYTTFWFSVLQPNLILRETAEHKALSFLVLTDPWKKHWTEMSQASLACATFCQEPGPAHHRRHENARLLLGLDLSTRNSVTFSVPPPLHRPP